MSNQTITYATPQEFYEGVKSIIELGLHFHAFHGLLTIELTGGY